jgi:hypothetical protein
MGAATAHPAKLKGFDYGYKLLDYDEYDTEVSSRFILSIAFACESQVEDRVEEDQHYAREDAHIRPADSADHDCGRKVAT